MSDTTTARSLAVRNAEDRTRFASTRLRTLDPYWVVSAVLAVLLVSQTLNRRWSSDFWLHKATIDALRQNLWHPIQPLTGTHVPFEYYSPYTLMLAALGRITGWSTVAVLQIGAVFNLVLFLVGFRLFVGQLTNRLAITFALVATLFFWGWQPWRWSGFLNFDSIGFGLPFPSMFATGLALFVAWALLRYDVSRETRWLVLIGIGLPVVMLSHPFTGVWTAVLLTALAVHRRLYRSATRVYLLVVLVAVAALLAAWPYYSFYALLRYQHHAEPSTLYAGIPLRLCAAVVGLVAIARRVRRDRRDPLALMFIGGGVLYAFGALRANYNYGRVLPLVLLPLHIGIGELIASSVDRTKRQSPALLAWLGLSAAVGVLGVLPALVSMVPHALLPGSLENRSELRPITSQYRALAQTVTPGSVVVVETSELEEIVAAQGLHPLSVDWAGAFVPDAEQRLAASRQILSPKTSAARRHELIQRYHVVGVLCATPRCRQLFPGQQIKVEAATLIRIAT